MHGLGLQLIFDELLERAREKEEKEAKKRKRLGDDFFSLLCSFKVCHFNASLYLSYIRLTE